ncbi:hypothetical protein SeMB42_g01474 [Synchytrium endobioticum]|uniref:CAF1B/HIR1 beta-propeller domain-containing protein n=1 Tax=Synchytrium endobioticum TaxID=286115 RepID=A0A507DGB9_9FUNG|nr:hypothetical protein SeLEV6574_g01199 [Synchytrium endobioticum]TPX52357.1 hypothetical protein SeMB42_g01474 [Synchytrium endobioticum]
MKKDKSQPGIAVKVLQIHWHAKQAVYSIDFEPATTSERFATGGADSTARIWTIVRNNGEPPNIQFRSTLARHSAAVNAVRWSPNGGILASAGDDASIVLWKEAAHVAQQLPQGNIADEDEVENLETWRLQKHLKVPAGREIYDIAWSPDARYIISGCFDYVARIWDTHDGKCIHTIETHSHFVQGVAWDPLHQFIATQSSDRSVHVYAYAIKPSGFQCRRIASHTKFELPKVADENGQIESDGQCEPPLSVSSSPLKQGTSSPALSLSLVNSPNIVTTSSSPEVIDVIDVEMIRSDTGALPSLLKSAAGQPLMDATQQPTPPPKPSQKSARMYHDETLVSFFRRLTFSPDGSLLVTPTGQYKLGVTTSDRMRNGTFIFGRGKIRGQPILVLPNLKKPSIAVRFCSKAYELRRRDEDISDVEQQPPPSKISLPYRLIFAVAAQDAVSIYDTQQASPLAILKNLHYASINDMAWSPDGRSLMLASSDGFCSMVDLS